MEKERKRVAAQKEREERDKRLFAEKVVASRLRSEQSRAGAYSRDSGTTSGLLVSTPAHLRDTERNSSRASKLYSSNPAQYSSHRVDDTSSGSSRPPSLSRAPYPTSPDHGSRPASMYSNTSSEDMRLSPGSRRDSYASLSGSTRSSMVMSYPMHPMWAGSHQSLNAMQMQMVPNYAAFSAVNDVPLLPPNAPFMKQSRQSSSPDRSRRSSTHSQSSESRGPNRSSTSLTSEKSPTSPQWPNHRRQSTGNVVKGSDRASVHSQQSSSLRHRPAHPPSSHSQPHLPRGRPPLPNYPSSPQASSNPWTALPTQTGNTPTAMPPSSYSLPRNRSSGFVGPAGQDWRSTLIS